MDFILLSKEKYLQKHCNSMKKRIVRIGRAYDIKHEKGCDILSTAFLYLIYKFVLSEFIYMCAQA